MATRSTSGCALAVGMLARLTGIGCLDGITLILVRSIGALFGNRIHGYDGSMPVQGLEDWDFWLGALEHGWQFAYVPEILI